MRDVGKAISVSVSSFKSMFNIPTLGEDRFKYPLPGKARSVKRPTPGPTITIKSPPHGLLVATRKRPEECSTAVTEEIGEVTAKKYLFEKDYIVSVVVISKDNDQFLSISSTSTVGKLHI